MHKLSVGPLVEVGLDEFSAIPVKSRAKSWRTHSPASQRNQLGTRFPRPADLEEVNAAGAAGSRTGARQLGATKELITLDLPTLERPRNAISGRVGAGNCAASVAAARNRERTLMLKFGNAGESLAS